jgi:hypothetical protein
MSAAADVPHHDSLLEDDAHFLKSRAVLRIGSQQAAALQGLFTAPLDRLENGCIFALHVDDEGRVVADAFLVRSEGDVLIDCDREDVKTLRERLTHAGIAAEDVSGNWRVFAELPNQATHGGGPTSIRVADPRRRELGARVYRRFEPRESTAWRHEGLYLAHANRLGIPPRAALLRQFGVDPIEAQFHALGALDAEAVAPESAAKLRKELRPQRRLLPFRVEPTGFTLPDMNGASLLAGETVVGVAINRHGLFGLGLVDLGPWRRVLADGVQVRCADEPVLITWPTWIARQSEGRASPAAQRNHAATP